MRSKYTGKEYFIYTREKDILIHDGTGYNQGTGFKIYLDWIEIFRMRFITGFRFSTVDGKLGWASDLKKRLDKVK